jgi:signal transduction histidine kinase
MTLLTHDRAPLAELADYLSRERDRILEKWRAAVESDPAGSTASAISRAQFNDHIPEVMDAFESELRGLQTNANVRAAETQSAAEHGLHRWQQGYDQRETMSEWGRLHLCMLEAIEHFGSRHPDIGANVMCDARQALVRLCNRGICESAARFAWLQRAEAASRVHELEQALEQLQSVERERAEIWREAAHDLRGSVSAVSSAAAIVGRDGVQEATRSKFSHSLRKSVSSLHVLLSDLMSLARLEAGHDLRGVAILDVGQLLREFGDAMRPVAADRGLFLNCEGPDSLIVEGDGAKVRRIAQNLVLNALNATERGGVRITWESGTHSGIPQWVLCIQDTGPGFSDESAPVLARALKEATDESQEVEVRAESAGDQSAQPSPPPTLESLSPPRSHGTHPGEGIGLSIVKRLCEVLDASLELESAVGKGTTFRVTFPSRYADHI